jgi:phage terminase small subunit
VADLTPKQEAFARVYVEVGNASEAYRQAYDAENMSQEAIWVEACRTLANPNVSLKVMELQKAASERTLVTVESLTRELNEDRELARKLENPSAAVSAVMGKAKLHGLITDKTKNDTTVNASDPLVALLARIAETGPRLVASPEEIDGRDNQL